METNSDNRVKILPQINTILTFYGQANLRQYLINTTQVLTLALRSKIMQHNNGGTVWYWQPIQFQILVNLLKWYIQIFWWKMVVKVLITDLENQWLSVVHYNEDTGHKNSKPSTLPYLSTYTHRIIITSIAFCQPLSMHHLHSTFN